MSFERIFKHIQMIWSTKPKKIGLIPVTVPRITTLRILRLPINTSFIQTGLAEQKIQLNLPSNLSPYIRELRSNGYATTCFVFMMSAYNHFLLKLYFKVRYLCYLFAHSKICWNKDIKDHLKQRLCTWSIVYCFNDYVVIRLLFSSNQKTVIHSLPTM